MDPDANLREQREIRRRLNENENYTHEWLERECSRLVQLTDALDTWVANGGALPQEWAKGQVRKTDG